MATKRDSPKRIQTGLRMARTVYDDLRRFANFNGMTIGALVEEICTLYLEANKEEAAMYSVIAKYQQERKERNPNPFTATGGSSQ